MEVHSRCVCSWCKGHWRWRLRDNDRKISSGDPWCICKFYTAIFALFPPSLRASSRRALVAYHLERGGMLLDDAGGVNCEKRVTTEYQGAGAYYMG